MNDAERLGGLEDYLIFQIDLCQTNIKMYIEDRDSKNSIYSAHDGLIAQARGSLVAFHAALNKLRRLRGEHKYVLTA